MKTIKPSVSVELWLEKPDVAEDRMNSDSADAADYTAEGVMVVGVLFLSWVVDKVIKRSAGPFGGIIDMAMSAFKKPQEKPMHKGDQ